MFWETLMSKGYLVANLRVQDENCFKEFSEAAVPLIEKFGGKILEFAIATRFDIWSTTFALLYNVLLHNICTQKCQIIIVTPI